MAWSGYFEYGGTEIINAARTEAYARNAGIGWFKPVYQPESTQAVPWLLGDGEYDSPLQDDAPWTDYRDPDSYDFLGAYPLSVQGIEDSTWTANVVENVADGGVIGGVRKGTRSVVFQVVLVARSVCGAESGMRWLREALGGRPCLGPATGGCGGHDLCYFRCPPLVDFDGDADPADCLPDWHRNLRNVSALTGPTVGSKQFITDGGAAWIVDFTMAAGNPYEWGQEQPVVAGFCDPRVQVPYVGGVVPDGGSFDMDGTVFSEYHCPKPTYQPLFDPECPAVIPPPGLPSVPMSCYDFPVNFSRRQFVIPPDHIPLWQEEVPLITIKAFTHAVHNLRIRFYADVLDTGDPSVDPCNYCGDMVFSYIPRNTTMVFDGADRQVYVEALGGGSRRRADSLVFATDGEPFDWPGLSCGLGYIVTVDMPQTQEPPVIDLSLYPRGA